MDTETKTNIMDEIKTDIINQSKKMTNIDCNTDLMPMKRRPSLNSIQSNSQLYSPMASPILSPTIGAVSPLSQTTSPFALNSPESATVESSSVPESTNLYQSYSTDFVSNPISPIDSSTDMSDELQFNGATIVTEASSVMSIIEDSKMDNDSTVNNENTRNKNNNFGDTIKGRTNNKKISIAAKIPPINTSGYIPKLFNPISPGSPNKQRKYSHKDTINAHGYKILSKIEDTLQGSVFNAISMKTKEKVVVKMTNIELHSKGITIQKGKKIKVKENVIQEKNMMKLLNSYNPPLGFVKELDFFRDSKNFFLIQQHGGSDFFDYVYKCHEEIKQGKMPLKQWIFHGKVLISQIARFLSWLHNYTHCCHLDISLENMLIKDVIFDYKKKRFISHGYVNIIDFGLAEFFSPTTQFRCNKYVGKTAYKAPKVYAKKEFDARKADVWSFGVCMFMILCGCPPYEKPSFKDPYFVNLWNKNTKDVLKAWGMQQKMQKQALDLLEKIFVPEKYRLQVNDILKHKYLKKVVNSVYKKKKLTYIYEYKGMTDYMNKKIHLFHSRNHAQSNATSPNPRSNGKRIRKFSDVATTKKSTPKLAYSSFSNNVAGSYSPTPYGKVFTKNRNNYNKANKKKKINIIFKSRKNNKTSNNKTSNSINNIKKNNNSNSKSNSNSNSLNCVNKSTTNSNTTVINLKKDDGQSPISFGSQSTELPTYSPKILLSHTDGMVITGQKIMNFQENSIELSDSK